MQQDLGTLLERWRKGELNEEELAILKDMIRSEEHEHDYLEILSKEEDSGQYDQSAKAGFEKTYRGLMAQIDAHESRPGFHLGGVTAIAASIVFLLAAGVWVVRSKQGEAATPQVTQTEFSGKQFIKLPDGTAVTLNDGSSITMSSKFGEDKREVVLVGEAFFDVAHVDDRPFIVRTQGVNTTVLGTAFNVKAYRDQTKITVTVMRGKVTVSHADQVLDQLTPNEELTINASSLKHKKASVNAERAIDWKSEYLILDNVTMLEASRLISRHFKVNVSLGGDKNLEQCHVSAYFLKGEPLKTVISSVCLAKGLEYSIQHQSVAITGTCQ